MAVYKNLNPNSPIEAVEFSPVSDGNFTFFYIENAMKKDAVKALLTSPDVGQEVVAETKIGTKNVLITHGDKTQAQLTDLLAKRGDRLQFSHKEHGFDAWAVRGTLGLIGQILQLSSSFLRKGGIDKPQMAFSTLNLVANGMAIAFGSQKREDLNRLRFLKGQFNESLEPHVLSGEALPAIDEKRVDLHKEQQEPKSLRQRAGEFFRRNSVYIGELGLRYAGAIAVAFPVGKSWKEGAKLLGSGEVVEAFKKVRNKDNLRFIAGMGYLTGKSLAFFAKVPDPYDPKPHSALDRFREKYLFNIGGNIEMVAGAALAMQGFTKDKINLGSKANPKVYRDFIGGTGGVLFATGYFIRNWAPLGKRKVNMEELNAHITDSLAKLPPEKLPGFIAEAAADVVEHFQKKGDTPMDFGKVYTQIMTDLYRYHHIALDNLGTEPQERLADAATPAPAVQARHTLATGQKRAMANIPAPTGSHAEQLAAGKQSQASSLSV